MLKYTICFIRRGDELLLLNRTYAPNMGLWNGVGGKLEPGETPLQSVLREIAEETGIRLETARFTGVVSWSSTWEGQTHEGGMYAFVAELPPEFPYETPKATDEGLLDWKPLDWVAHPRNFGVVDNIPRFLPTMLSDPSHYHYRCTYVEGILTAFASTPLEPALTI